MKNQALLPATDEMRECCSLLSEEMLHWPGVKMYHLFGTCAFYHRKVMFAMLADKRSLDGTHAISFKAAAAENDATEENWQSFEVTDRQMLSDALDSLKQAYRASASPAFSLQSAAASASS